MKEDFSDELAELRRRLEQSEQYLGIAALRARRPALEAEAARPELWDDPERARSVSQELAAVNDDIDRCERLGARLEDADTLWQLAVELDDDSVLAEIAEAVASLRGDFDALELRSLLAGAYDERDAVCGIQSGEGGTDSQDWASMLLRMYGRWAERRGFSFEVESVTEGREAGITSAEFSVKGRHAYGLLRSEHGIHRLVRVSPFNKEGKRQTAFASVKVVPFFPEMAKEVEIDEGDLRIDTYRSSGAGGQHVNVTDSAVRITHLPTGLVTSSQAQRSQHQNRERAMQMLAAKLLDLERRKREQEVAEIAGAAQRMGFGSQIRSYVLYPYQIVKDLRTEHATSNPEAVLDGDLEDFIAAYLRWRRAQEVTTDAVPAR
ncbi:MAG: peptide chain release factor 2 [Acidimicrobiia bacterium]|nr:peptide chain release factor 2 [Acidimicrobiia bacterium]